MALTEEQEKGLTTLLDGLGGKSLADVISKGSKETASEMVNGLDKRLDKKLKGLVPEGLSDTLTEISKKLEEKPESKGKGKGDGEGETDAEKALSATNEKLTKRLEVLEKADIENKATNERLEGDRKTTARNDAITTAAIGEKVGLDPAKVQFLLPWLTQNNLVREVEGKPGTFEMDIQKPDQFGDAQFKPLGEGMEIFAKTDTGKGFRAPVNTKNTDHKDDKTEQFSGESVTLASLGGDPAKIREASEKGINITE